ncbi:sensor histidine kinase [Devosia riboflavina]
MKESEITAWFRWIAPRQFFSLQQVAIGLALAFAAVLLRLALLPALGDAAPYFLLIPTLFVATVVFGGLAGLVCLVSGAALTFFFILHEDTTSLTGSGTSITTWAFLVISITLIVLGVAIRGLVLSARAAHARADLLAGEMGHRVKNILALAQVIVRQSAKSSPDVSHLVATVEERLIALARAQNLAETHSGSPPMVDVITDAVSPFGLSRFSIKGDRVAVDRETAKNVGLLLHELCTNSMKYGALAVPAGRVSLHWELDASALNVGWQEVGGPTVHAPTKTGFGSKLARGLFVAGGGGVTFEFLASGVHCNLRIPLIHVVVADKD